MSSLFKYFIQYSNIASLAATTDNLPLKQHTTRYIPTSYSLAVVLRTHRRHKLLISIPGFFAEIHQPSGGEPRNPRGFVVSYHRGENPCTEGVSQKKTGRRTKACPLSKTSTLNLVGVCKHGYSFYPSNHNGSCPLDLGTLLDPPRALARS